MSQVTVNINHRKSLRLIDLGLKLVFEGKFEAAKETFQKAHRQWKSAESFTYWGWMEYQLGNVEKALRLCKKAIQLDPEFGNAYNDLGSYLVVLGQEEEAVEWFEKAIAAPRYEARHYPHINLARLYLKWGQPLKALTEFKKAHELFPGDPGIESTIQHLLERFH